jgi:hypothetical protein
VAPVRKVRVHKVTRQAPIVGDAGDGAPGPSSSAAMDRSIAELIPGLAELNLSSSDRAASLRAASSARERAESTRRSHQVRGRAVMAALRTGRPSLPPCVIPAGAGFELN